MDFDAGPSAYPRREMNSRRLVMIGIIALGAIGAIATLVGILLCVTPTSADLSADTKYAGNNVSSLSVAPPSGLAVAPGAGGSIELSWSASPSTATRPDLAFSYDVYRRVSGSGSFALVTLSPISSLTYLDVPAADGNYDYLVRTVISSFTSSGSTAIVTALSDRTPPATSITCNGTACGPSWYTSGVSVTISATDSGSGVRSITYSLDGGAPVSTSGSSVAITVSGDSTGHILTYQAADNDGNSSSPATQTIKVDSTGPTVSSWAVCDQSGVVLPENTDWIHKNSQFEVYANVADAISGVAAVSAAFGPTGSPASANFSLSPTTGTCAGASYGYTSATQAVANIGGNGSGLAWIDISATDVAGNGVQTNAAQAGDVNLDNKAPNIGGLSHTPGAPGSGQITLTWNPSNFGLSGGAGYLVKVYIAGTTTLVTSTAIPAPTTTVSFMLTSGTRYDFSVEASDNAGNNSGQGTQNGITAP